MISIDQQPWAHRGGPAFVTSKLSPIADPCRSLMNWPCSPSLFNWWRVPFQVDHHYVPRIHWFSKTPLLSQSFFFPLSLSTSLQKINQPPPWLDLHNMAWGVSFNLHLNSQLRLPQKNIQCLFVSIEACQVYQLKSVLKSEQKSRGFSLCSHSPKRRWSSWLEEVL